MVRWCWLLTALWLCACSIREDVVARIVTREPGPTRTPDAGPKYDASPEPEPDAGCPDADGCAEPPEPPPRCAPQGCTSLTTRTDFCAASQPPVALLGDSCGDDGRLQFHFAVCSCSDLITNSSFTVDALGATGTPASIAINDELRLGPDTSIAGAVYVTGRYGATAAPRVSDGVVQNAPARCGCGADQLLNVLPLIAARSLDNDNAAAMLDPSLLNGYDAAQNLSLDCGRYYLDEVNGGDQLTIDARGRVGLFIAGDLSVNNGFKLNLAPGASAVIFVEGNVHVGGRLELGSTGDANRVLLVVNGTGTVDLRDALIQGTLYAPRAELVTRGPFEVRGSLFVNRANLGDDATVHFRPLTTTQSMCSGN